MDKSAIGIVGVVAGVIGIVIGVLAYMEGSNAGKRATEALNEAANAAPTEGEIAEQARKAVAAELERTRADVGKLVQGVEERINALEEQATRVDILAEAKRAATENAERTSKEMFRQVTDLKGDMRDGDAEAVRKLIEIQADIKKQIDETRAILNRKVDRWIESGVL